MSATALRLATTLTALALATSLTACSAGRPTPTTSPAAPQAWTTTWSAALQRPSIGFEPNWSEEGFSNQTIRQVVRVTTGGTTLRVRLSNRYGSSPLAIDRASLARTTQGAAVDTLHPLTFGGAESAAIPAGGEITSDPVDLPVQPLESLTTTLYLPGTTGPATTHLQGYATSYRANGDHSTDPDPAAFTDTTHSWYYLSGIEVLDPNPTRNTVVVLGDSITDGFGSTNDTNNRYPDHLANRLVQAGTPRPVLNAGIGGCMVLSDSAWYGDSAHTRLDRDVLANPRVGTMIVLAGLNDIGFSEVDEPTFKPNPNRSVDELIAGHRDLIRRAHEHGIRVIGGTLLPLRGADYYTDTAQAKIDQLNQWIRTSGEYDAVADFNAALADPTDPTRINPTYDSGDHKHPNDAGYQLMADTIDLSTL